MKCVWNLNLFNKVNYEKKIFRTSSNVEVKEGDVINIFSPSSITKIYEDNFEDSTDFNSDLSTTIFHTIIDNENLLSIAKEYGVTVYDIVNANPKLKTTPIKIDQVIKIPYFDEVEENNLIGFLTDSQFNEISYGSFWINLGVSKSNNNADELASYLRREFDDLLLGKTKSSSIPRTWPKPWHFLQAPTGLLKVKKWTDGSSKVIPSNSNLFEKWFCLFDSGR